MNILVTGGAGYIGSILVPLLLQYHDVVVLDNLMYGGEGLLGVLGFPNFQLIVGDIYNTDDVQRALVGIDAVVHLAALGLSPCKKDPYRAKAVNSIATEQLLSLAGEAGIRRFLFASTSSCYGKTPRGCFSSESTPVNSLTPYAETKVEAEKHVLAATGTVMRFATVFGISPKMRFDLIVNEFALDAVTKRELVVYGGKAWRSHIYIRDLARAIALLLELELSQIDGQIINVGGHNCSKADLAKILVDAIPDLEVHYQEKVRDTRDYRVGFSKAAMLGIKVPHTPAFGIREVAEALRLGMFSDPHSTEYRRV